MTFQNQQRRFSMPLLALGATLLGAGAFYWGRYSSGDSSAQSAPAAAPARADTGKENAAAHDSAAPTTVLFEPESLKLANLEIAPVTEAALSSSLKVTGAVEPNLSGVVKITPRVAGKVTSVRVNVGDSVRASQTLATVASMELANAQADYDHVIHQLAIAETNLARQKKLASLDAFSRPQVEDARTRANEAEGQAQTARTRVAAAQAGIIEARDRLTALQAALAQTEAQVAVSQSRFDRAEKLLKEQLLSQQEYEQVQADMRKARADVLAAQSGIAQGNARVETAKALLQTAKAELTAAQRRSAIAAQTLAREEKVYKGGYVAGKELFEAETAVVEAQHEREAVLNRLQLLGGAPKGSNIVTISAPIGGRVTERTVTLGETVGAEKELFEIIDLSTVWVQLSVYQKDAPTVRPGQSVAVRADTAPGHTFRGVVSHIADEVNPASRSVKVRCLIQNIGARLKPGTFVTGEIAGAPRGKSVVIPQDAVQDLNGKKVVFTPGSKEGEFLARPVQIGERSTGLVQVTQGLNPGERVVTKNAFLIKSQAMKAELSEE